VRALAVVKIVPQSVLARIGMRTKLAFGIGAAGESATNWIFNALTFFYYNQILGLSGTLTGMAVTTAIVIDGVTDPVMGSISDRYRSRWGRRHPFMFAAPAPLVAVLFAIFYPPAGLGSVGLFVWLTFFTVAMRVCTTLFAVPHLAMGAELSDDYDERSTIMSYNNLFTYAGGLLMHLVVWFVVFPSFALGQRDQSAYGPIVAFAAVLIFAAIFGCAWFTRDRIASMKQPPNDGESINLRRMARDILETLQNRDYLYLLLGLFFLSVMIGTHETLSIYMATFYWELTPVQIGWLFLGTLSGYLIGFTTTARLHRWLDKRTTIIASALGLSVFWSTAVTLRLFDLAPPNTSWALVAFIIGFSVCAAGCGSILNISVMSALADVSDVHELKTGRRQEGVFYAARTLFAKTTNGIGHVIAGIALDVIAFPSRAVPGEIEADKIFSLGVVDGPFALVWGVVATALYRGYRIDRARHARVKQQLTARRAGTPVATSGSA
jgi:glycoside/pentoside/hexuronide:cation symporter, GPH family